MATVIFQPQKAFPPRSSAVTFSRSKHGLKGGEEFSLTLKPGANTDFSEANITQLQSHPDFPQYEKWGAIEIVGEKKIVDLAAPQPSELGTLNEDEAIAVIENCHDAAQLTLWLKLEQRVNIRRTLNTRINNIKKGKE
jgi:hypothetical protein